MSCRKGGLLRRVAEGARVSYELFMGRNGETSAENLRIG